MKLQPSDPNLQTLFTMLESGDINPQPEFQRGEVWGVQKKRRLIDTILRNWHVPPIHVIKIDKTGELEVLDGQQRLSAIRDFFLGKISVDGDIQPHNPFISQLDGATYDQLPEKLARQFRQFPIRMFTVDDYTPEEPGELFYRLNQPTNLTAAEHRNAYYGKVRQQIKELVRHLKNDGANKDTIGFSNSRMAYDDVLAKYCFLLEAGTLKTKVTSNTVTDIFRADNEYSQRTISLATTSITLLLDAVKLCNVKIKLTKTTLQGWLLFLSELLLIRVEIDVQKIATFIEAFELFRSSIKKNDSTYYGYLADITGVKARPLIYLIELYNNRASSRVADVSSVTTRDFIVTYLFYKYSHGSHKVIFDKDRMNCIRYFDKHIDNNDLYEFDSFIPAMLNSLDWGNL